MLRHGGFRDGFKVAVLSARLSIVGALVSIGKIMCLSAPFDFLLVIWAFKNVSNMF